jgi:uncharacterized protein YjbJ (UPF0337 family)
MASNIDDAKGRIKQAAGKLTDDRKLEREGDRDRAGAKVKDLADRASDKVAHAVDRAKDKMNRDS